MDLSRLQLQPHKLFHHLEEVLRWRKGEYFPPIFVNFSPTDLCNQNCWYCYTQYLGHKKLEIQGDLLVRIFQDMGHAGVKSVMIQGTGEPLLNKSTPDAIVEGRRAGLSLALCTNGVLLNNEVLEKILPSLEWMRVSDVECSSELYAKSHGSPESHWHRVIKNLKIAVEIRERERLDTVLSAHMLLFPYNAKYVVETTKMIKDLGLDYILIKSANQSIHNPQHRWPLDTHKKASKFLEEAKKLEDREFKVSIRYDQFEVQQEGKPFKKSFKRCYGLEFETMVDADGGVYPCLHFWRTPDYCYGNLYERTFEEIWKGERRRQVLDKIYNHFDLDNCHFGCKHRHINETLWELANPPMHVNFL
jgi:radical SAM protein with 4Fe4S-binding SPASM domain